MAVKGENGKAAEERIAPISQIEFAPLPYDVAVGFVPYQPETPLYFQRQETGVWQEVATLGYPLSAAVNEGDALWMNLRAHRGYVQRATLPRDMLIGTHPPGLELSFLIGPGISGAPIFTVPGENVIGVAVGSNRSEIVDDSVVEVDDNGREFRETRLRIEQYGFGHQVDGLLDWRPSILSGKSLLEAGSL